MKYYIYVSLFFLINLSCNILNRPRIEGNAVEILQYNDKTLMNYKAQGLAIMLSDTLDDYDLSVIKSKKNPRTQLEETFRILSELSASKKITLLKVDNDKLPNEFILLKNTEFMDISDLKHLNFNKVFSQLSTLPNLKIIISSRNHYGDLPDSICKISSLEGIFMHYSEITTIPECLAQLPNLNSFGLAYGNNNMDNIASVLSKSTTLDSLHIAGSNLTKLPEAVSNIKNLKYIDLFENDIKTLPCSLANRNISIHIEENRNYKKPKCLEEK